MTNCIHCKKEFEAKRTDAKFCSDTCRKANNRGIKSDKVSEIIKSDKQDVRDKLKPVPLVPQEVLARAEKERKAGYEILADNLIEAWKSKWILENHDLKTLEANKVWIPNWRRLKKYES